jgi:hypothetical protein
MAKQKGIIPVVGTIGELTFKQTRHGFKEDQDRPQVPADP